MGKKLSKNQADPTQQQPPVGSAQGARPQTLERAAAGVRQVDPTQTKQILPPRLNPAAATAAAEAARRLQPLDDGNVGHTGKMIIVRFDSAFFLFLYYSALFIFYFF